jgi:hypothetical protein
MSTRLFGFSLDPPKSKKPNTQGSSFGPPVNQDGAMTIFEGGVGGSFFASSTLDMGPGIYDDIGLINRYREMSLYPEIDDAVNDIVNETIIRDDDAPTVDIDFSAIDSEYDDEGLKDSIREEFEYLLELLNFVENGYELFRQWYVDGRLYFNIIIDEGTPSNGITELRLIDPRCIKPIREVRKVPEPETASWQVKIVNEYFVYNEMGIRATGAQNQYQGVRIAKDAIAYIHSGLRDQSGNQVLSYLHKVIKPLNQLRMMEDSSVIYRLARAPERRMFYVDVGNLPRAKAEAYLQDVVNKYRNKLVYDSSTGEIKDDRKFMTMLEDFFLPRREGSKGTEVSTLQGGSNLGQIEDIEYFKRKVFRALNVPYSRSEPGQASYGLGRAAEITRDEVRFARFLNRLRSRFSTLFDILLARQLTLKNVIPNPTIWDDIRKSVRYQWQMDSHYAELKDLEIIKERMGALSMMDVYSGRFFSDQWLKTNVLRQTDEEQEEIQKDIDKEKEDKIKEGIDSGVLDANGMPTVPGITAPNGVTMPQPMQPPMGGGGAAPGAGGPPKGPPQMGMKPPQQPQAPKVAPKPPTKPGAPKKNLSEELNDVNESRNVMEDAPPPHVISPVVVTAPPVNVIVPPRSKQRRIERDERGLITRIIEEEL